MGSSGRGLQPDLHCGENCWMLWGTNEPGVNAGLNQIRGTGMKTILLVAISVFAAAGLLRAQDKQVPAQTEQVLYQTNFQSVDVGKVPDDFLVLDGAFAVKADGAHKVLEL